MNENKENLNELLKQFYDGQAAKGVEEDIRKGDDIFKSFDTPEPSEELINEIKMRVRAKVENRQSRIVRPVFIKFAAAAAVALIAFAGVYMNTTKPPVIPTRVTWENIETETAIASLSAEIDSIAESINKMDLEETNSGFTSFVSELESEITDNSTEFWKG